MNQQTVLRFVCIVCLGLALLAAACSHKKKGVPPDPAASDALPQPARTMTRPSASVDLCPVVPPTPQSERSVGVRAQHEADLRNQFRHASLTLGAPIYIRIFKKTKELELWVQRDDRFMLFKKYPIALFSGGLGPKTREGDLQAPEGFYTVTASRLNPWSNYHLAFNIGYPNQYDLQRGATGGAIMVHGKEESVGCFAMTDPAIEEIYTIADYALSSGQPSFQVHIFPFRMTVANLMRHTRSPHLPFWRNLLRGYTLFELTRLPPVVSIDQQLYAFTTGQPPQPNLAARVQENGQVMQQPMGRPLTQPLRSVHTAPPKVGPIAQTVAQPLRSASQALRSMPTAPNVRRSGQTIP